jgi:hypothetical protein
MRQISRWLRSGMAGFAAHFQAFAETSISKREE